MKQHLIEMNPQSRNSTARQLYKRQQKIHSTPEEIEKSKGSRQLGFRRHARIYKKRNKKCAEMKMKNEKA